MINGKTGIGFRKDFEEDFLTSPVLKPNFIEVAPENWIDMGGYWKKIFDKVTERYPLICHGLSLSIGSPDELDWDFLKKLKVFLKQYKVQLYSEHLSYAKCDNAHLYDLLPIPFREDAVKHIIERIKTVQDFLEQNIAIENVSYYTPVAAEMDEPTFISSIINGADCKLLLDVNNVYVNSFNHKYDAHNFIKKLPLDKVAYIHMAGHLQVEEDLIIDTHAENIIDPVFDLFEYTIQRIKPVPVLLERDYNFPEFEQLQGELNRLQNICNNVWIPQHAAAN
jgi:hypothetical protein